MGESVTYGFPQPHLSHCEKYAILNFTLKMKTKRRSLIAVSSVFLLAGVVAGLFALPVRAEQMVARRLDGVMVPKSVSNRWPVAVMIDNHTSARPQAGLSQASVVYETLAEGGIPRFMAVFVQPNIKLIGPVRSARPYFVRYAAEYRAGLAHAGGSPDALNLLRSLRMPNIEGLKGKTAAFFFRYGGNGVHNFFTNTKLLTRAIAGARYDKFIPYYRPWQFADDPPLSERRKGTHGATIDLGAGKSYAVRYVYDRKRNAYQRYTGGKPLVDRVTKRAVYAKNVVILMVPKEKVLDRKGRLEIKTLGKGKAILLKDGIATTVNWSKPTTYSRTVFTAKDKRDVVFNRGSVWITVLPAGHGYKLF